jgi:alpha-galactosidase
MERGRQMKGAQVVNQLSLAQNIDARPNANVTEYIQVQSGAVSLLGFSGGKLNQCYASVVLSDGSSFDTRKAELEGTSSRLTATIGGGRFCPELRWNVRIVDCERFIVNFEVINTTERDLSIERLDVLVAPTGLNDVSLQELSASQNGWMSWSYACATMPLSEHPPSQPPPMYAPMLPPTEAERSVLPWMTQLATESGARALIGFLSGERQLGTISLQPTAQGHRITASNYLEGIEVPSGQSVTSEDLLIDFRGSLKDYARVLAERAPSRSRHSVPTGWCSWYYFYESVTEQDVLRNLSEQEFKLDVFQIDDGYQSEVGDWLTPNDKFPSGMRNLAERIHAKGMKAGIWIAPFIVSERSNVFKEHPDWVLRDHNQLPQLVVHNWNCNNYALDTTNPEVVEWLQEVFCTIVDEWKFDYIKIDFIYAAALRGRRWDKSCTSVQAYRKGLQLIRCVAKDAFILGCGAPFLPSIGLVDGMRVGRDVLPAWGEFDYTGTNRSMFNAIRSTIVHSWMQPELWANDPDCLMVRGKETELGALEVETWASVVALSGGMLFVSDELTKLEKDRADLINRLLPPYAHCAVGVGPVERGAPTQFKLSVEKDWETWTVAGVFNWLDDSKRVTLDIRDWNLPAALYHVFDLWAQEYLGATPSSIFLGALPPHAVKLLALHPVLDRPQVLASNLHVLGGAVEFENVDWNAKTLSVTFDNATRKQGKIYIFAPPTYEPYAQSRLVRIGNSRVYSLEVDLSRTVTYRIPFSKKMVQR